MGDRGREPEHSIVLTPEEDRELKAIVRKATVANRLAQRARLILMAASGEGNHQISQKLDISRNTVIARRARWNEERMEAIHDRSRSGRPRIIPPLARSESGGDSM